MVRAFGNDAPPAKLAFYSPPRGRRHGGAAPRGLKPLADWLRLNDAGQQALLADWLHGCLTAPSLEDAMAQRAQLQPGEVIFVPSGHAVTAHSVSFYAPDSEQAGLLARAQEIENLDKQLKAQVLIAEQARSSLIRAEAAYTDASQRLVSARREAAEIAQPRARTAGGGPAPDAAGRTDPRAQRADRGRPGRGRRAAGRTAGAPRHRRGALRRARHAAGRQPGAPRPAGRHGDRGRTRAEPGARTAALAGAHRAGGHVCAAQPAGAPGRAAALASKPRPRRKSRSRTKSSAPRRAGAPERCRRAGRPAERAGHEAGARDRPWARCAASTTTSPPSCAPATNAACSWSASSTRCASASPISSSRNRPRAWAWSNTASMLEEAQADLAAVAQSITEGNVRLTGLQGEIDRLHREIQALGAVNLAALDELTAARERKTFLDAQTADLVEAMNTLEDAIKKIDDETRELLGSTFETVNDALRQHVPRAVRRRQRQAGDDRRRDPGRRRAGDGAAARQEEPDHPPAVGRRKGADRHRAGVRDLPAQPGAVLPARRGGRAAGRRQHRALRQAGHGHEPKRRSSCSSATTRSPWKWPSS